jgi:hypothetical protein
MSSNRIRVLLVSLLAVFAISAVASASSASAFELKWKVCQKVAAGTGEFENDHCEGGAGAREWKWVTLVAGEEFTTKSVSTSASFTLVQGTHTITCTHAEDTGTIKGGNPGTDTAEVKFTGCTTNETGCLVKSKEGTAKAGEIFVKPLKTRLVERNGKLADLFEPATGTTFVTLEFGKKEKVVVGPPEVRTLEEACTNFPHEGLVTGAVAAEVLNEPGSTGSLNWPNPELEKNTLKIFGLAAKLTGKVQVELTGAAAGWGFRGI